MLAAEGPYLLGEQLTVADIYMCFFAGSGFEPPHRLLDEFPAVRECFERLAERPRLGPLLRSTESMLGNYLAAKSRAGVRGPLVGPRSHQDHEPIRATNKPSRISRRMRTSFPPASRVSGISTTR